MCSGDPGEKGDKGTKGSKGLDRHNDNAWAGDDGEKGQKGQKGNKGVKPDGSAGDSWSAHISHDLNYSFNTTVAPSHASFDYSNNYTGSNTFNSVTGFKYVSIDAD